MGTNRLKHRDEDDQPKPGTGRLKPVTGKLKPGTAKLKPATGKLKAQPKLEKTPTGRLKLGTGPVRTQTGPLKPKYTTAQLRLPPSKRRRRGLGFLKMAMISLALVGAGGTAAMGGAYAFLDSLGPAGKKLSLPAMAEGLMPIGESQNILLLGADYSYAEGRQMATGPVRSDTILVAGVNPGSNSMHLVSIPRDTRVLIRGHYDKVNSALALGGPKLTAQVVSNLLGVPIHHWAKVNTRGLERLVDVVGGVDVYVEKRMHYVDRTAKLTIDIPAGMRRLSGTEAHQFVRFRHDELGDIGRVRRQQQFLQAASAQMLKPETMLKMPQILACLQENIATDMTGPELMKLATWGVRLKREDVKMVMLPGEFSAGKYAASYWLADPAASQALGRRFLTGEAPSAVAAGLRERLKITVLNGTSRPGLAARAADELRQGGWNVYGVGDAPQRDVAATRLIAQTGHDGFLPDLGSALGVEGERVTASIGDVASDFTVIVGEDFAEREGGSKRASR